LSEVLYGNSGESLKELDYFVPDLHFRKPGDTLVPAEFHVFKSHHGYSRSDPHLADYKKVIYIVRDPRDVVLSYHRYRQALSGYKKGFGRFIDDFLKGAIFPGSWRRHVESWLGAPASDAELSFHCVRYEDLAARPLTELEKIVSFMGVRADAGALENAVRKADVKRMREKEKKGARPGETAPGFSFIGTATAGRWHEDLEPGQAELIVREAGEVMRQLGYV
jgi:hypothetical protein